MSEEDYNIGPRSINDLFKENKSYEIPDYQCAYAWNDENAVRLFDDLVTTSDSDALSSSTTNLLGAVVIQRIKPNSALKVVDGQQRLATLSLIFCAIRTYLYKFVEAKQPDIDKIIKNAISEIDKLVMAESGDPRVTLGAADHSLFRDIVTSKDPNYEKFCRSLLKKYQNGKKRIEDSNSLMIKNYQVLCEKVERWANNEEELPASFKLDDAVSNGNISHTVTAVNNLAVSVRKMTDRNYFAYVQVDNTAIAYKIFSTFNSLGQTLLESDLIKSHLLSKLEDNETAKRTIAQSWKDVFDERLENPDTFLYESLMSRHPNGKMNEKKISKNNMYAIIDSVINTPSDVQKFVDELKEDSKFVKYMDHPEDLSDEQKYDKLKSYFHSMQLLNARYIRVPILAACREFGVDSNNLRELVGCLLRFFFMFRFINEGTAETVRAVANDVTMCMQNKEGISKAIYRILIDEDAPEGSVRRINNDRFKENFPTKMFKLTSNTAKYVLSTLEVHLRCNSEFPYPDYPFELEHILPKNHNKYWDEKAFLNKPDSDNITKYKNRLGNLTLLSQSWNCGLGAMSFADKTKEGKKGYAKSTFELTRRLGEYSEWTATNLEDREKKLCDLAPKVWSLDRYDKYLSENGYKDSKQ